VTRPTMLLAVAVLAGCAGTKQTVGGWFGAKPAPQAPSPQAAAASGAVVPRPYYAGTDGLKVYAEPSASSKVVGTLALHEKVTRTRLDRGWAYVETEAGLRGWVANARLVWRLPASGAPATEEEPAEEPAEPETPETAPAPAATPVATTTSTTQIRAMPRRPTTTLPGVPPSIFNPY